MDPSLVKQRNAFKARALAQPAVEKRRKEPEPERPAKRPRPAAAPAATFDYKSTSGSSQFKFAILAKIIKFMKTRHQTGDVHPLTLEDILDETNQLDITARQKHWLGTEALNANPKIDVVQEDNLVLYKFRGKFQIKNRQGLLKFLDKNDQRGMGGTLQEDVEESLPQCEKHLKKLGDSIMYVTRPIDKRKILFYNDKSYDCEVDEELQKLWRASTVEGMDERKIEEYLARQGIASMQDLGPRVAPAMKRKKASKKNKQFKSHNDHVGSVLKDYSDKQK